MNRLTAFFRKLGLRQILTVFLASVLLFGSAACNSGVNAQGANPSNPAVQAGGANNPYKGGGDGYTNYKMSTDPKVGNAKAKSGRDQANLQLNESLLVAINDDSRLLYPGSETPAGRAEKQAEFPVITNKDFQRPEPGGETQRDPNLGDRVGERIDTVTEAVKDASKFVGEKADEAGRRPESQSNPALRD